MKLVIMEFNAEMKEQFPFFSCKVFQSPFVVVLLLSTPTPTPTPTVGLGVGFGRKTKKEDCWF